MLVSILVLLATHLIVPIILLVSLWISEPKSQIEILLAIVGCGSYLLFIFMAGRWDWMGYFLRYLFLLLFVISAIQSVLSLPIVPVWTQPDLNQWVNLLAIGFVLAVFIPLNFQVFKAYSFPEPFIPLSFPLQQGTYYVGQGGSSSVVNQHYENQSQRFALDVVKLNQWGIRARGLYPSELNQYEIFETEVYSPCNGEIVKITNNLPDSRPPDRDQANLPGNSIVIKSDGYLVVLAHLRTNSIVVREGEFLKQGQIIAKVGNSGNTTEPHLHIHAVQGDALRQVFEGTGVPMLFDNQFLVRNSLVKR